MLYAFSLLYTHVGSISLCCMLLVSCTLKQAELDYDYDFSLLYTQIGSIGVCCMLLVSCTLK